ncbi:hypothetical protein Tco_1548498 [Tanacetum coccineum]
MPLFDGEDVYGWVYQAERLFEVQGLNTTRERLRAAVLSLEGPALSLFWWINNQEPITDGKSSKDACYTDGYSITRFIGGGVGGWGDPIAGGESQGWVGGFTTAAGSEGCGNKREAEWSKETPFGPRHRCLKKSLHVLLLHEDVEEEADDYHEDEEHAHLDAVEVSAHFMVGITTPHTMKLQGTIHGYEAIVLIDSGGTHNFMWVRLVKPLGSWVIEKRETRITFCKGKTETSLGIFRGVEKLGETWVNLKELTMSFQRGVDRVTLRREIGLRRTEESLWSLARTILDISEMYLIALTRVEDTSTMATPAHPPLVSLLTDYSDIFVFPAGLAPPRDHENAIVLKTDTEPINVRPYWYPQLQKDDIEKLE